MSDEDRAAARRVVLPTHVIPRGEVDLCELLEGLDCFGAIVLEGMLLQRLEIADHVALRLLGPADVISLLKQPRSMLLADADCQVLARTRVALLGRELLAGAQRWPQLLAGLHVRVAEQSERVAAQLAICQLPRVEQRLLAIMWLLAESWGHVTKSGTSLPLSLTHDVLGGLVGARRSTVTLALGELAERGALIRQDGGWLLLEPPPMDTGRLPAFEELQLIASGPSVWQAEISSAGMQTDPEHLRETVERLREQHERNQEQVRAQLERVARTRTRLDQRRGPPEPGLTDPPAPSSGSRRIRGRPAPRQAAGS